MSKTTRIEIRATEAQRREVDRLAAEHGVSRSEWLLLRGTSRDRASLDRLRRRLRALEEAGEPAEVTT